VRILSVGNRHPPWSAGGYEATWAGSVAALRGVGHAVRVLTTRPDPTDIAAPEAPPPDVHRDLRWYWRAHAFPPMTLRECLELERANATVLAGQLRAFAPDVVMWWAMGGMSLSLLEQARRAGVPALAVVGDEWVAYGPGVDGWTRRWRRLPGPLADAIGRRAGVPARLSLDRAAEWSFNSDYTRAVSRAAGWRLEGATVEHPGVAPERLRTPAAGPWAWRLLYCGRVDPRKGIATAVRALAELPAGATLRIHGDGDGEHLSELGRLAAQLDLESRVTFTAGPRERVADVYAASDAVVFPVTWREPWGLVPLEAMAAGRPVVATDAGGGAAEYLRDGLNCLHCEPGDAGSLARAVARLAGDHALREAVVRGGRETAARYPEDGFHAALEQRLHETVARGVAR
jgi:glycosyltransferase involved in cell wall biosynthesis